MTGIKEGTCSDELNLPPAAHAPHLGVALPKRTSHRGALQRGEKGHKIPWGSFEALSKAERCSSAPPNEIMLHVRPTGPIHLLGRQRERYNRLVC